MDVTSLLNSGATAAAEQLKQEAKQENEIECVRTPTRNRTPWDAGGYSLPINTISMAPTTLQQVQFDNSRPEGQIPTSPRHKFSDSRSSLSSFTSSLQSATHSRFSSMSTVNSTNPTNGLPMDSLSPKSRNAPQALELANMDSRSDNRPSTSLSPTGSLEALAFVAEHHPFSQPHAQQISDDMIMGLGAMGSNSLSTETAGRGRASSPSDAILIKRTNGPILRLNTGETTLQRTGHLQ
jgi:hypothetical protein